MIIEPMLHTGSCLGLSGGESWESFAAEGNLFGRLKVRPIYGFFFCNILLGEILQLPLRYFPKSGS